MKTYELNETNIGLIVFLMAKTKKARAVMPLVSNLKTRLDGLDWSYKELAHKSGISEGAIKQIMRGRHCPNLVTIEALAGAIQSRAWELVSDGSAPTAISLSPKAILLEAAEVLEAYANAESGTRDAVRRRLGLDPALNLDQAPSSQDAEPRKQAHLKEAKED